MEVDWTYIEKTERQHGKTGSDMGSHKGNENRGDQRIDEGSKSGGIRME